MFSLDSLDRLNSNIEGDTLKMGWAKSSLIPSFPTPLAGYGERKGKINIGVEDSIWVRTIVLDNGKNRAAYISLDLLIPPPNYKLILFLALMLAVLLCNYAMDF